MPADTSAGRFLELFHPQQARSRACRWGEDSLGGISDDGQRLCFALALWNERILKEGLLGLTRSESNHGEDVKEYYFYLDSYTFLHEAPLQVPHATSRRAATRSMTFLPVDVAAAMIVS